MKDEKSLVMVRPIVLYPDPVLQQPTQEVAVGGEQLRSLVEDLFDSMYEAKGVGLAAPQIGISKRVTVIDVSNGARPEAKLTFINPEIIFFEGQQADEEGCLSLPDIREKVSRAAKVQVRAQNVKGEWFDLEAEGLLSRALQHEIDHLDGILFFSRVSALKRDRHFATYPQNEKSGRVAQRFCCKIEVADTLESALIGVRIDCADSWAKGFASTAVRAILGQQMMTPDEVSSGSLSGTLRNLCKI
jgi:peptide deformylase